jgi:hypothetical protein
MTKLMWQPIEAFTAVGNIEKLGQLIELRADKVVKANGMIEYSLTWDITKGGVNQARSTLGGFSTMGAVQKYADKLVESLNA